MVRAGEGGYLAPDFERLNCVAIGWPEVGDLASLRELDQVRAAVARAYSDAKPGNVIISGSTLHKFRSIMRPEDRVVTYDPVRREYLLGTVKSDYTYETGVIPDYPHRRKVEWAGRVSRDVLSSTSKNTLGSIVSLFEPGHEVLTELETQLGTRPTPSHAESAPARESVGEFEVVRQDAAGRAHEFLKDRLLRLSPEEMEELVAALLRAMGYKSRVTPKGPDRGRDVVASPDGLGFQHPRIFAEVKHRPRESMGSERIRSFLGGLREGDCGLYVSTGGYTKDAHYEADRAKVAVTLVDLDRLAELIVEHYERLDEEGRALVPLVRVYWPAS
jgi:restriction system protein